MSVTSDSDGNSEAESENENESEERGHDFPSDEFERGPDHARRDRVSPREALISKRNREEWAAGTQPRVLETNEILPDPHLEELRRFKRDRHILVLASNDLPDEVKDVVDQAERYMRSRLRDLDIDVEPHRMISETDNKTKFL